MLCVGDSNISDVTLIWQLSFSGPPLEMSDDKMEHSKNGILESLDFIWTWIYSNLQKVRNTFFSSWICRKSSSF